MWPDEIPRVEGTIYLVRKHVPFIYLRDNKFERTPLELKSWRKKVWVILDDDTWYRDLIRFEKRNAAIMWLKRYGKENITYRLARQCGVHALVKVVNGYVYFYNPDYGLMISAESKRTCNYATRNN